MQIFDFGSLTFRHGNNFKFCFVLIGFGTLKRQIEKEIHRNVKKFRREATKNMFLRNIKATRVHHSNPE